MKNIRNKMLCYLSIKNIVLIEKLELAFDEGFTVLTGETGAGKSIIVDAISLILGKRSERRLIRKGQEAANVTALFKIPHSHIAINFANENGFIIKEEIILRRQILSNGRSQCFLNDEAISLSFMKDISSLLIEVHGQNDQAGLLDSSNHIHILDDWYNLLKNIKIVSKSFFILKEHTKKYNQYVADLNDLENKKNYLAEDLEELINLDLKDNEIDTLIRDRNYLMSIEKIRESLNKINYFIQGEVDTKGIYENLSLAKNQVSTIMPLNIEKFKDLDESIDRAMIELKEVEI
ncbi:AAA family ATPase, partial [Alphaproteobacteria bacterium]|nr:AAA family ATPase [Alphaproteobacteria bacterium]